MALARSMPPPVATPQVQQAAVLRAARRRRRKIIFNLLAFMAATVAMVLISLSFRDDREQGSVERFVGELATMFNAHYTDRRPPPQLPRPQSIPPAAFNDWRERLCYLWKNWTLAEPGEPIAICYTLPPTTMYLRPPGRGVVLYNGVGYEARWMPESEFQRRREALDIPDITLDFSP
jgi:hypothetical protein